MLNVNLGAISRLETISVQSHGENTQGMEIVCKVHMLASYCFSNYFNALIGLAFEIEPQGPHD